MSARFRQYSVVERRARQYRNELGRLVAVWRAKGLDVALDAAWYFLAASLAAAIFGPAATKRNLDGTLMALGFADGDLEIAAPFLATAVGARRAPDFQLIPGDQIGRLVGLTWQDREAARIISIEPIDETKDKRKRRLDCQRKAARREEGARSRAPTRTAEAARLGISRSRYYQLGLHETGQKFPVLSTEELPEKSVQSPKEADENCPAFSGPAPLYKEADKSVQSALPAPPPAERKRGAA